MESYRRTEEVKITNILEKIAKTASLLFIFIESLANTSDMSFYYCSENKRVQLIPHTDKLAVKFQEGIKIQDREAIFTKFGLRIIDEEGPFRLSYLENPSKNLAVVDSLRKSPYVLFAYPVFTWLKDSTELTVTNQFRVKFKNEVALQQIKEFNQQHGVRIVKQYSRASKIFLLELPWGSSVDILELVNLYYESLLTEYVVPNFELKIKEYRVPNDDCYSNQWALPRINVPLAWDITTGNNDIVIAIIDEGVDFSQKDLDDKLIPGIDVTNQGDNSPQPYDWDARGTACAGIAGAETDNNQGIAGVAWNCKIMPIQIAYEPYGGVDYWITTSDWIVSGIDWAVNNGADVLSNNWGGGPPDDDVHNALINAVANGRNGKGRIVAFSSGNYYADASSSVRYPAKYPEVIAVGAVNENDERCSIGNTEYWGSCYGPGLDVTAPGIHIFVTDINGEGGYSINDYHGDFGGTSAACPHVAGLAALILSNNPNLTWQQVKKTICLSADRVPRMRGQSFTDEYGYGRINANKALRNLYVPQVYHTIASALSIAIDSQAIVVSGSHVLSSNLTVPAGVTLQFKSGSSVSLNGYSIVSVGGAITIENGININPDVRLMTGSSIKGLYPSIGLAVQEASNGDRVVASGVSKTCEDDLGVPGGMTLELEGCNMEFDSGVWLKVLGALKADNSTFTRPGGSSNWKGIRFYDSAVDSSCVIENSTISYAGYGVYTFLSNPGIRNNRITNCTRGEELLVGAW